MEVWLVLGATGTVGRTVVSSIQERIKAPEQLQIKLATHTRVPEVPDTTDKVRFEQVSVELQDPSSVESALVGVDKVAGIFPDGPAASKLKADFFRQAKAQGVKHLVYLCYRPPQLSEDVLLSCDLTKEHFESEQALVESGLAYTIIRVGSFMQNMVNFYAAGIRDHGAIFLPTGDCRSAQVDVRDLGEAIARILERSSEFTNKVLVLTGTPPLSYSDMAEVFSQELGRKIAYLPFAGENRAANLAKAYGMTEEMCSFLDAYLFALERSCAARSEVLMPATDELEALLGRKPRQLSTFVRDHRAAFSLESGLDTLHAPVIVS